MALTIGELVAFLEVDNRGLQRGLRRSEQDMERFQRDANGRLRDMRGRFVAEGEAAGSGFGSRLVRAASKAIKAGFGAAGAVIAPLAALPWTLATVATGVVAAAPLIAQGAGAIADLGSSALSAAPALIALKAAIEIAKLSLTAIFAEGTAARKALEPLTKTFEKATEAGSKAAARGIKPLAEQLRKVIQPTVTKYMVGVGNAANIVQRRFLKWAKSAEGVRSIRGILEPISAAMQRLAPQVSRLIISFTAMLGRIMGVSTAAGTKGAAKALDWLADRLDRINKASVQGGMNDLLKTLRTVKTVVTTVAGWIQTLIDAYKMYTTQFGLLADAVTVAAIIFGGPVATIIGVASLIIRHFGEAKAAWLKLKAAFAGDGAAPIKGAFRDLQEAGATVLPSLKKLFEAIKVEVLPPLKEIGGIIVNELVPAIAEFIKAAAPVVAWLVDVLTPIVSATFAGLLNIIKGALNIIVGIFRIFTGILTGDWGKVWSGVQSICKGALQIVWAIIRTALIAIGTLAVTLFRFLQKIWNQIWSTAVRAWHYIMDGITGAVRSGARKVKSAVIAVKNGVFGVFSGAGRWLWNAGKAILDGLIGGIRSAVGRVKSELGRVTGLIPDWKGPMSVDMRLLEPSGRALMTGLMDGITGALPSLHGLLGGVTSDIAGAVAPPTLQQVPASTLAAAANRSAREVLVRVLVDVEGGGDQLKDMVRGWVRVDGGGNVQAALGSG
ncbi:hypothetical protein E1287_37640 [Actinomadura sp. KC06]|uniref:phage tail protein n=1 Tax=Actinomadura sp. KC06 TaxID=2530369 RepID=UPI0010510A34|nr:hypothetical protein [Actinomadura sp. KC06]TDD25057.1 hypothetical protein E1287_37640 [Actinomadura sp. KC06]